MTRDTGFTEIVTARLRLRRFTPADVEAFLDYRSDPDVARYQSWREMTLERAARFVEEMDRLDPGVPGEPFQFAVARRDDDALVGDCMLAIGASRPPEAEVGYTIAPAHQRAGYATEAVGAVIGYTFDRHGVGVVRAVTDTRNLASIALAEHVGMRVVATMHTTFEGEPCEEHTLEITTEAWGGRS